jgi:transcriptional regulator with XRE-family HTH domain
MKTRGLSQNQLAEVVGINTAHLSRLENDRNQPSVEVLEKLAGTLQVSTDHLLSDTDDEAEEIKFRINHLPIKSGSWIHLTARRKRPSITLSTPCSPKRKCSVF